MLRRSFAMFLCLVMVLSILVGCSMMFAGCSGNSGSGEETKAPAGNKHDPAQYEGLNDEEYLQKLGYNNLSDAVAALTDAYDVYKSSLGKSASAGAKGTMTITVGDDCIPMTHYDWLKTIASSAVVEAYIGGAWTRCNLGGASVECDPRKAQFSVSLTLVVPTDDVQQF